MLTLKSIFPLLFLLSLACAAGELPAGLSERIEHELRATYDLPESVKIAISAPHASEFPNYDSLSVTLTGDVTTKNLDFLLSKDQKTLIRTTKLDLTKDPYAETMKKIDVKGRPVRGNPKAKVVVINYDDFECPFCSRAHQTLFPAMLREYGDRVAFIYKDFPLSEIHPWAIHAAVDANCLASENSDAFWDFADFIHHNQSMVNSEQGRDKQFAALDRITLAEGGKFKVDPGKLETCMKAQKPDAVMASLKEGESLGIDGTPTMFVNGQMVNGALSADEFRTLLDKALKEAGVTPPQHPEPAPKSAASAGTNAGKP